MGLVDQADEPALVRRQLGHHLRRLRLAAGKTHADAETAGMGHRSTMWRIEAGRAKVRPSTVRALCWLYDADAATSDALYAMACQAERPGWWEEYRGDLPTWFTLYVELEAAARRISTYQPSVVDGRLQTPDYARAIFAGGYPRPSADEIERQVTIRVQRQHQLLARQEPVHLELVLCESVLLRAVGGPSVLAAQREQLRALNRRENVDVRVLAFAAGAHPAVRSQFTILDLDSDADPDVVYLESLQGGRYLETSSDLARYRGIFAEAPGTCHPAGGVPVSTRPSGTAWIKAARSGDQGECVEMRRHAGAVEVRDSKDPDGPVLRFTPSVFAAWLDGARKAEFDHLAH